VSGDRAHWRAAYDDRAEADLSWFEAHPDLSCALVTAHAAPDDPVIDVGAGAARLVDALLARGYAAVTALDISDRGLAVARARLGPRAAAVTWIVADVTDWQPDRAYALWHDRAVFHFLTEPAGRAGYVATMQRALRPGGVAVIATFAEDGPEMCSGLPVRRYAPRDLAAELEAQAPGVFAPLEARRHTHVTPQGRRQRFQVSVFRREGG
jgi:SAM-dependent methyltransferase